MTTEVDTAARVFFALWLPPAVAAAVGECVKTLALDATPVVRERLHLTLAFHGDCDASQLERLRRRADALDLPAFPLVLDRIGHFSGSNTVWLGPSTVPEALRRLATALAPNAGQAEAFVPHVTVARRAAAIDAAPIAPIAFAAGGFALVESGADGTPGAYRTLSQWRLDPRM